MTYCGDEAFLGLSDEQWVRLQACGSAQEVESGALLSGAGEATHDLILVDSGEVEVVRAATARAAEAVVAGFGTGQFSNPRTSRNSSSGSATSPSPSTTPTPRCRSSASNTAAAPGRPDHGGTAEGVLPVPEDPAEFTKAFLRDYPKGH
jgi:hypothetical protein